MDEQHGKVLQQLVAMSVRLAAPENDLVILGEGNTSAAVDEDVFFVKASGYSLVGIAPEGFVAVSRSRVLRMLEAESLTDAEIKAGLRGALINSGDATPSVEATFHALLLGLDGIRFVGHTHPTAVNSLLCARNAPEFLGNLFPDQIVCCGIAPLYIPYTDPGVALARAIKRGVQEFHEKHGELPKVILMQNHGMVALGRTPAEVESACAMQVKTARVLLGTMAFGGPNYFSDAQSARIHTRPDEDARRKLIFGA